MHIKVKQLAFPGVMAAFSVVLMLLGNIIESSTLFFTAAASFLVGVAIFICGNKRGIVFFLVCVALIFLLLPNKMYCLTYSAFGLYILVREMAGKHMTKKAIWWGCKYLVFNIIYIPLLLITPTLFINVSLTLPLYIVFIAVGQIALLIFDIAYEQFMRLRFIRNFIESFHQL